LPAHGAVIFGALGLGAVLVVADFGGPGDIVNPDVGYKIPLVNEEDMLLRLQSVLKYVAEDRNHLETLRHHGMTYRREHLKWEGKAHVVSKILPNPCNGRQKPSGHLLGRYRARPSE